MHLPHLATEGDPQQLEILGPLGGNAKLGDVQLVAQPPCLVRLCNVACSNVGLDSWQRIPGHEHLQLQREMT